MMAKSKKKAAPTSLRIDLFDPGMTPLHRAGLGGLAATLERLDKRPELGDWTLSERAVELCWEEDPAPLLDYVLHQGLAIENPEEVGIVDFPAMRDRFGNPPSYEARLLHQEALTGTMLQHGKSRQLGTARQLVLDVEAHDPPRSYRPLQDFKHQEQAGEMSKAILSQSYVQIAGWALPGAVEKHPGSKWSRMEVSPGSFLALCFAPVGAFSFKVNSRLHGTKHAYALVIPHVDDLCVYGKARRRLNTLGSEQLYVASSADAALLVALATQRDVSKAARSGHRFCSVMTFGVQPWAKQQKTRTKVMDISLPEERALAIYRRVSALPEFQTRRVRRKDGSGSFFATSPSRAAITEALVEGKTWWEGVAESYLRAPSGVRDSFHYSNERRGLHAMIYDHDSLDLDEKLFVEVCHNAMRQIYASVGRRTTAAGTQFGRKSEVEMTKIRSSLLRAKNAGTLRDVLVEFWARASRDKVRTNRALTQSITVGDQSLPAWQVLLPWFDDQHWKKARSLALVALLSYSGVEQETGEEIDEQDDTSEDQD